MPRPTRARRSVIVAVVVAAACGHSRQAGVTPATTLKDAFRGAFRVGAALNANQFSERDARAAALIKTQFNTITPENVLKWE